MLLLLVFVCYDQHRVIKIQV